MTTADAEGRAPDPGVAEQARRAAVRAFRPYRMWPTVVAAVLLLAVAGAAASQVISALAGVPLGIPIVDTAARQVGDARWDDPEVQVASAVLALIGLLLIVVALLPGEGRWAALRTDDPDLLVGLSRTALRRTLTAAVLGAGGVESARVVVRRRRIRVRVRTELAETEELRAAVTAAVEERLADIAPLRPYRLTVDVRRTQT
ncbi:hypothetical protein HNR23_004950 [Nocardiopsis mwathae]|uniref:DUF6286 domain-containing protein n=1 Tax=Nocardiopsis mwathae TaxID=1472723 RepID=A0A7X0D807_9ACTN|nr:DUF6286 domain-containing protein [Nocardiopsis mwathae]MBB6174890.1 hypothetical protein [Nocardiopsis mwathae]